MATVNPEDLLISGDIKDTFARSKNPFLAALLKNAADSSPIRAHSQGAARLANSLLAGLIAGEDQGRRDKYDALVMDRIGKQNELDDFLLGQAMGGQSRQPQMPPQMPRRVPTVSPEYAANGTTASEQFPPEQSGSIVPNPSGSPPGAVSRIVPPNQPATFGQRFTPSAPAGAVPVQSSPVGQVPPEIALEAAYRRRAGDREAADKLINHYRLSGYDAKVNDDGTIIFTNKTNPNDIRVERNPAIGAAAAAHAGNVQEAKNTADVKTAEQLARNKTLGEKGAEQEIAARGRKEFNAGQTPVAVSAAERAIKLVSDAPGMSTGVTGQVLGRFHGTAAHTLNEHLNTLKANLTIDKIMQTRAVVGSGLLNPMTENDRKTMSDLSASLDVRDPAVLKENIRQATNFYLDAVYGPGNGPPRYQDNTPSAEDAARELERRRARGKS